MVLKSTFLPESVGIGGVVISLLACWIIYSLGVALYNVTLHPLAKYPGPLLRAAFHFPLYWEIYTGELTTRSQVLHDKYGYVVRMSPTDLSYNNAEAWQDIYGQRQGKKMVPKDPNVYIQNGVPDIILSNDADHARIRRTLSHAFSESALTEQESLQNTFFTLLIQKLTSKAVAHEPVNLVHWFNFATFDLIGDLSFGESFNALESEEYDSWMGNIVSGFKFGRFFRIAKFYPVVGIPFLLAVSKIPSFHAGWKRHEEYTAEKSGRRLDLVTERRDLMSYILRHNTPSLGMTREEIIRTSSTLIIAGSETTSTMLSGSIYNLLRTPHAMAKLQRELRSTFSSLDEMNFLKLQGLKYLNACIQEGFRIYPAVPMVLPRRTLPGGAMISGRFVPEDIGVGIHQWSAYHSPTNFLEHEKYIPERWLGDPRFADDNRAVLQPFSVGPRNCLGRHLAMAQMRSILARVVWNFDMTLCEESLEWSKGQLVFNLWEKPPLMVKLEVKAQDNME